MKRLILGGVKSGKSRYAEQCVKDWVAAGGSHQQVCYIATAHAPQPSDADTYDSDFAARIAQHRAQRPASWQTCEESLAIAPLLRQASGTGQCLLLECLTLWLSNVLHEQGSVAAQVDEFCAAFAAYEGEINVVSNETGLGIMPINALARRFGDEAGVLQQRLAAMCDEVVMIVAGLPLFLKTPNNDK